MIDMSNFMSGSFDAFDINLVQKAVGGGIVTAKQIDEAVKSSPNARSIVISGLKQDTFEHFVHKYGKQFEAISFWKNKLVSDLSPLESLDTVKYINYFLNQRAASLWDMKGNTNLRGLCIYNFSRLHNINEIETAPVLEFFGIGNAVWKCTEIESLRPAAKSAVTHLECYAGVLDGDYKCLANGNILELDMNPTQFTVEELAELLSLFPVTLKGTITKPYVESGIRDKNGRYTKYYFLCKNRKRCIEGTDDKRFAEYLKEFDELLMQKRHEKGTAI